ncbi:nucleotidyltransferase domain-containing protein [Candidatus Pacearchaeota archaeon]|nr:nucleotidyltransferase domain-containing protein [Candidatus Pacearchaeota archaeon]
MLEKIFTSKTRVRILSFLLFEKREAHIRGISKMLRIPVSSVKREVDNLLSIGIIKKQENKILINEKNSIIGDLKNIFVKTDFIAYPLEEAVRKNRKIKYVLIFGSFARGEYKEDSDIDLMIIGDIKLDEVIKIINPIENQIKKDINPIVWNVKYLIERKNEGFVRDLFSKKIIMIKGDENELRKIIKRQ